MNQERSLGQTITPWAIGLICVVLVLAALRVVNPALAVFQVVLIVWFMSWIRKREKHASYETQLREWYLQNPDGPPAATPPIVPPPRNGWSTVGTVLAVAAAIGGLAILATVVLFFVALSSSDWGNK